MICPINPEVDLPAFRTLVYSNLIGLKDDLDVKAYMKSMYDKVLEATNDEALALDYARLIPTTIDKIRAMDPNISKKLRKENKLDVNELADLVEEMDEANLSDLTKLNKEFRSEEKADLASAERGPQPKEQPKYDEETLEKAEENLPEAPTTRLPLVQNIIDRVRKLLRVRNITGELRPLTAFYTRNQEVSKNENNRTELEKEYAKKVAATQRALLESLESQLIDDETNKGLYINDKDGDVMGKVVLTLVPSSALVSDEGLYSNVLDQEMKDMFLKTDPNLNGAMLVPTDETGNPINFLEDGSPTFSTTNGKPIAYNINTAAGLKNFSKEDNASINEIAKFLKAEPGMSKRAKAERIYVRQLQAIKDARDYVANNPGKTVQFDINGGSLGFLRVDATGVKIRESLSKLEEDMGTLTIVNEVIGNVPGIAPNDMLYGRDGYMFFSTEGMYGQPVILERPTIEEAGLGDMLTSLIVDDLVDVNGNKVTPARRRELLDQYLNQSQGSIRVSINNEDPSKYLIYIQGTKFEVNTEEDRDKVRPLVKSFLVDRNKPKNPIRPGRNRTIQDVLKYKTIVTDINKGKFGDVYHDVQNDLYYNIESAKLHPWKAGLNSEMELVDISTKDGVSTLSTTNKNYKDFVKDKFYIGHVIKNGKLQKENPYLTFQLTVDSQNEVYKEEIAAMQQGTTEADKKKSDERDKNYKEPDTTSDEFLDGLFKSNDTDGFDKLKSQQLGSKSATKKQIADAKKWYENSPISKYVPFNVLFDIANGNDPNSIARWTLAGITLYKGSDYTDLYHEAWHAFSQAFMTSEQRAELYKEVRRKKGNFTDHTGKVTSFKNATDLQVEEYLAEQFRTYMLKPSSKKVTPKQKSIFRKILDFLREVFTGVAYEDFAADPNANAFVQELFEKLRVGNIAEYSFNVENTSFTALDKGGVRAYAEYDGVGQLSYENTMKMVNTLDSLISEYIDLSNQLLSPKELKRIAEIDAEVSTGNVKDIRKLQELRRERESILRDESGNLKATHKFTSVITKSEKFLENAYTYAAYRLSQIKREKEIEFDNSDNVYEKQVLKKQIDLLKWSEDNFGDARKLNSSRNKPGINSQGLIAKHIEKSANFFDKTIIEKLDFEDLTETEILQGKQFDKSGNEKSMIELAKSEVIYLLKQIHKVDNKGKVVMNEFGIPEIEDFTKIWNRLARTLQNTPNIEDLYIKLTEASTQYPQFQQILNKLGPLETTSRVSSGLWTNFASTFGMPRVPLIQVTVDRVVDKDGNVKFNQRTGEAFRADYSVGREWQANFSAAVQGYSVYIGKDKYGSYLDIDRLLKDFNETNVNKRGGFDFFNAIGFTLTDNSEIKEALENNLSIYSPNEFYKQIKSLQGKRVRNFNEITEPLSGRYKALQILEAKNSDVFSNFMVTNAEGNTQFEHTLPNTMTNIVNGINSAANYYEIINTPHLKHLDINLNPFAESSLWLKSMFNLTGTPETNPEYGNIREYNNQRVTLEIVNLSGIMLQENGEKDQEGIASAKADEFTKLILDIHLGYNRYNELTRHADKSTSYAVRLNGPALINNNLSDSYVPAYVFGQTEQKDAMNKAHDLILPHIIAEVKRMFIAKNALDNNIKNTDFKYLERGKDFFTFKDYLETDTKNLLKEIINTSESKKDLEQKINDNLSVRQFMYRDTVNYFKKSISEVQSLHSDVNRFVSDNIIKDIMTKGNRNQIRMTKDAALNAIVAGHTVNTFIHHLESISLLYGDLAQYKSADDFFKRNAGIGSTGELYRTDAAMQMLINHNLEDSYEGRNKERLGIESVRSYDGTFNTGIVSDVEVGSAYYNELKDELDEAASNYDTGQMNEADAQGLITFDAYKKLKLAHGSWSNAHNDLYNKIINNEPVDPADVYTYFPVIKAQYWGALKTDLEELGLPITGFHKYSLMPIIPSVVKGKNLELVHDRMMQEGIDYMTFESGSKVGIITENDSGLKPIYKPGTRTLNIDSEYNSDKPFFTKNVIFLEYLKDQLKINDTPKGKVIFSTQLRKLIEDGLIELGVPVDFKPEIKDEEKRIKAWESALKNETADTPYYKLIKNYENVISKLVNLAKQDLLKEMQWKQDPVTKELSGDKQNLIDFISRELTRKELSDHELEYLSKGKDLSLSLNAQEIEKMMNSLIVKKLVKQKINGESLVQLSGALMEDIVSTTDRNFKNPSKEDLEKYGTNDLPFYTKNSDGTTKAMKVKVALLGDFVNLLDLNDVNGNVIGDIETLNKMIRNEEWLNKDNNRKMITMTGVRIPVQGLNSMEFMEVYEFLPAEAGGVIISPSEIVAKSGADFDIDKMTVMMPNISRKVNRAKLTNKFLREMQEVYPDLDFSRENVNMVLDFAKGSGGVYTLTEEDNQIINILEEEATTEIIYNTGENVKGLQNELITSIVNILSLPINYKSLVRPNSTDIFTKGKGKEKSLSERLEPTINKEYNPKKNKTDDKITEIAQPTRVLDVNFNLKKHSENAVGKRSLGLGAVDNTYNTLFNRIGAYMNPTVSLTQEEYLELNSKPVSELEPIDKESLNKFRRQKLFLDHNKIGESISLSHLTDTNGQNISDVINQMINGWVDIAKDQWIFNIQGNKEVAPTLLFMIQAGVPVETAVYFVSNPLVKQYVKEQKLSKSTFAKALGEGKAPSSPNYFRGQALVNILTDSKNGFNAPKSIKSFEASKLARRLAVEQVNDTFSLETLKNRVEDKSSSITQKDREVFLHFLEIEDMGKAVRDIKMKMNVDTSMDQSLYEAQSRIKMKDGLRADNRFPTFIIDNLINESPIGDFFVQPFQIELLSRLFPLRNNSSINDFIDRVELKDINRGWANRESFANDFKNDLISFMLQNELGSINVEDIESYKGLPIDTTVENVSSLKYGAALKDGVLYISSDNIREQYDRLTTNIPTKLSDTYNELGLAEVKKRMFPTFNQYKKFVIDREILRSRINMNEIQYDPQFKALYKTAFNKGIKSQNEKISYALEHYIRDKALENSFNNYQLFLSDNTYADQFVQMKQSYPIMAAEFSIFNSLEYSDSPLGYKNLKLNSGKLTADQKNVLYENLENLSNQSYLEENFTSLTESDAKYISNFFSKFPMVAFLQSGLNTKSAYSLTGIVSSDQFINVIQPAYEKIMSALNDDISSENYLNNYLSNFLRNSGEKARGKKNRGVDYTIEYSIDEGGNLTADLSGMFSSMFALGTESEGRYADAENVYDPFMSDMESLIKEFPGSMFVYNGAINVTKGGTGSTIAARQGKAIEDLNAPNTMSIRTFNRYQVDPKAGGVNNNIIKDIKDEEGNSKIDPDIAKKIDQDIQDIIDNSKGMNIVFDKNGYGKSLLTLDRNGNMIAPQTFIYLSEQLLENFNYINPEYLTLNVSGVQPGLLNIQNAQKISDQEIKELNDDQVRDLQKICKL